MRTKIYSCKLLSALLIAYLAACSSGGSGAPSTPSMSPQVSHLVAGPPTVIADNGSNIDESVTQSSPNCWSPSDATIGPGDSAKFTPTGVAVCIQGTLMANGSSPVFNCDLQWKDDMTTVINSPGTDCTVVFLAPNTAVWTYKLASPHSVKRH